MTQLKSRRVWFTQYLPPSDGKQYTRPRPPLAQPAPTVVPLALPSPPRLLHRPLQMDRALPGDYRARDVQSVQYRTR